MRAAEGSHHCFGVSTWRTWREGMGRASLLLLFLFYYYIISGRFGAMGVYFLLVVLTSA
jgi:hypothetical protein